MTELTCKELVELITDYLEGDLPAPDRLRFEDHLTNCDGCRNYLQQMQQTIKTVGSLSEETIHPQAKDELLGLFRHWKTAA